MISELLTYGWPGQQWCLRDGDYNTLDWREVNTRPKPALEEILALGTAYVAAKARKLALEAELQRGHRVEPEGFTLSFSPETRASLAQMLALLQEGRSLGMIKDDSLQTISDVDGQVHTLSTLRLRRIMVGYGMRYKELWDAGRDDGRYL